MHLGALTDHGDVLELGSYFPQKITLAPVRLEEDELELRANRRERDPRRAPARTHVHHRPAV
jgi:hypothetical protein